MQSFSFYAFKSSKFAYIALSYICMLSNLCKTKTKKELHDLKILFASVCTVTRQQNYDIMIQQQQQIEVKSI